MRFASMLAGCDSCNSISTLVPKKANRVNAPKLGWGIFFSDRVLWAVFSHRLVQTEAV